MSVDLHLHSSISDGSESPADIVELAVAAGLSAIALTDHDILDGIPQARAAAETHDLVFISGVELSVDWKGAAMHMLMYFLEPGSGPLQDRLVAVREGRAIRNVAIIAALQSHGVDVTMEEVAAVAGKGSMGRPHIARVLIDKGIVGSMSEAFDQWLATGRPGYVSRVRLDAFEAIDLARQSGAVPVIAHPHTLALGADEYAGAFTDLTAAGLGGIEAYYTEYSQDLREHLAGICGDLGIAATGGSDFHGTYKPDIKVGIGLGDLLVPDDSIQQLVAQASR
ncbi:MAG TPA: PHP domain-containing protein [Actinobacteria bacterium]|nr:error-prone DNA polymerase [bacterium BMS3Bbin02]HDL42173.1 PHP domain-containing protein [Actinomycetota bacterium]